MLTEERSEFLEWYESVKGQRFDFRKKMKEYRVCDVDILRQEYRVCDVDILRQACLKFRHLLITSGFDPRSRNYQKKGDKNEDGGYRPL